ncbi:MAG: CRISPR system precrRNA processing endoribonuclease RAMP protein Cas6, partial [Candidatus Poribacteria bacterium]
MKLLYPAVSNQVFGDSYGFPAPVKGIRTKAFVTDMNEILSKFNVTILRFWLVPVEDVLLPKDNKGWVFRGGLGKELRKIGEKAYGQLFNTEPPYDVNYWEKASNIPRPYVIFPPLETKELYTPQDFITFDLTLIGKAIDYLPYFVFSFYQFARYGVGRKIGGKRGRCFLERVETIKESNGEWGKPVYFGRNQRFCNEPHIITGSDLLQRYDESQKELMLEFLTPTQIIHEGEPVLEQMNVVVLIKSLWRRIAPLAIYHCDVKCDLDPRELVENAVKEFNITQSDLTWHKATRYSKRQDERIYMDGFKGRLKLEGNLRRYIQFLLMGELVHIGKYTT